MGIEQAFASIDRYVLPSSLFRCETMFRCMCEHKCLLQTICALSVVAFNLFNTKKGKQIFCMPKRKILSSGKEKGRDFNVIHMCEHRLDFDYRFHLISIVMAFDDRETAWE